MAHDGSEWLTDREQRMWRAWLFSGLSALDNIDADLARDNMDLLEYHILVNALEHHEGIRIGDLASRILCSPQRMTQRVKTLAADGLLSIHTDPADRRARIIKGTPEAQARIAAAAPNHVESVRRHVIDHLTDDDIEALSRISCKLFKANARQSHDADPPYLPQLGQPS